MSINYNAYLKDRKIRWQLVRGLTKVFGSDVSSFCACYVDDIMLFSKTFEEHLRHINFIFKKLTTTGFTINALKCKSCHPQMNFLGRVVGPEDHSNIKVSGPEKSKTLATISRHLRISS